MKNLRVSYCVAAATLVSAIGGYTYSEWKNESEEFEARCMNYTDRGRICIEAASMIRSGDSEAAVAFLEEHALGSIRGVPMGREYGELPSKSQVLLVSAQLYETAFPEVDLEIDYLVSDVPDSHRKLSPSIQSLRAVGL